MTLLRLGQAAATVAVGALLILGSSSGQKPAPMPPPRFEFTPPTTAAPNSAGVTFALVNARFSQNEPWTSVPPFNSFSQSLSSDFQEILAAKGFTVRGPFATYDEMTFPDKKGSDLVLQPDLGVELSSNPTLSSVILGKQLEADIFVRGKVTLSVRESLTGERMWLKNIDLQPETVHCEGKFYANDATVPVADGAPAALLAVPACAVLMGPVLERYYAAVMDAAWRYLEPEEMVIVKKQAQDIKSRKVY
ncbi:MAG: hypothetical protein ABI629_08555 [bacterium]